MDKEKISLYEKTYYQNYVPVPFQTRDGYVLNIYPALVKEWSHFSESVVILQQDKSKTNDIDIIKMSYLEFLYNLINVEVISGQETHYKQMLFDCLRITFKDEQETKFTFSWFNERVNLCLKDQNDVVKCKITPKEFNDIISIILTYNFVDYDDRQFSDDILKAIADYNRVRYKNVRNPSFEEQKAFVVSKTGINYKDINEMPYRLFHLIFEYNMGVDSYIGDKIIQGSYKYKVDENVLHPLYKPKTDILSEVFQDSEQFKNSLSEVAKA